MILLDQEFSYYGITLKQLLAAGKQVHWIEFGVGGGTSPTGDTKATTALSAAGTPFFGGSRHRRVPACRANTTEGPTWQHPAGVSGPYTKAKDPFVLYDLSAPSPVREYSRWFYNQTVAVRARMGGGLRMMCTVLQCKPETSPRL